MKRSQLPGGVVIASKLAWVWGILFGLSGLALGAAAVVRNGIFSGQAAFHLVLAGLAIVLCYVGYGLGKRRRDAGWIGIIAGVFLILLPLAVSAPLMWVDAGVNVVLTALIIANWRHLAGEGRSR